MIARSAVLGVVLALAPMSWALPQADAQARSPEEAARAHFRLGRTHYENGDFAQAAAEFQKAHRLSPEPLLLYNLYIAYRDANDLPQAAEALRAYLQTDEPIANRSQLEARLRALEQGLAGNASSGTTSDAKGEETIATEEETLPASDAPSTEPRREPMASSPSAPAAKKAPIAPWIVVGVGGALGVGAVVTGLMARSAENELERECPGKVGCDPDLEATRDRGKTFALLTDVLAVSGVVAVAAGITWWLVARGKKRPSDESRRAEVDLGCTSDGCRGAVRVPF